jgi:hypothetical protein
VSPLGSPAVQSGQSITPQMIESLRQTKPWVRMFSILGFIGTALMVGLALFIVVGAGIGGAFARQVGFGAVGGVLFGMLYLLLGLLYIFPSLFLFRYASGIASMLKDDTVRGMENALAAQKSFWRFVGILTTIVLCIYALVLVALVVAAIIAALR